MTTQTGKDAGGDGGNAAKDGGAPGVTTDDLDLVEIDEDAGKSDDEIWRELDAAEGEQAADSEADHSAATKDDDAGKEKDPAAAADEEAVDDDPSQSAAGDADQGNKPAQDGDQGAPDKRAPADGGAEPTLEELKAERDRLLAENRRLEQAERSNRNRVAALQRKYESPAARGAQDGGKPGGGKKKPFQDERGRSFIQEYPEVAEPVAKELEDVRTELDELKAERERRAAAEREAALISNEEVLDKDLPGWDKDVATPQFADWLDKQPQYVKDAVERNNDAIVDAAEAADIVGRFRAFRSSQGGEQHTQQGNGNGNGANAQDGPANGGKNGNSLSGKRQRQLDSSSGTRSSGPGLADGIPEDGDPEVIWKAFDRLEERQERAARRA